MAGNSPAARQAAGEVKYRDYENGDWEIKTIADYIEITEETTEETTTWSWRNKWYVISGEVTADERINVSGDVYLILTDGCTLNANAGIGVDHISSLTIYAQSEDEMGVH